jgi:hypothetical protein
MSPWLFVVPLIFVLFLLIMAIRGIRDFVIWYREGRDFAREQRRAKELRKQRKLERQAMPTLKERPADPSKSSSHSIKPPERPSH